MKARILLTSLAFFLLVPALRAADWPQLQNNPQRTGYSAENLDMPISEVWVRGFDSERIHPQVQPVVVSSQVFFGTQMGTFYSLDANTGNTIWKFPPNGKVGPILHTAGVAGDKVIFASLDGNVYALYTANGTPAWTFKSGRDSGFSTAVLLAEGRVFVASREGRYYAIDQNTGGLVWMTDVGAPILMSSAYDNGRIFFGTQDLHVVALDASSGQVLWRSQTLPGITFKDYWSVVYQGMVFISPQGWHGYQGAAPALSLPSSAGPLDQSELDKQDMIVQSYQANPNVQNLFVFDAAANSAQEVAIFPHWLTVTLNTTVPPPCVDGDGYLIVPVTAVDWKGGWGRLNTTAGVRKVTEFLWDGNFWGLGYPDGMGNPDEQIAVSAAGKLVFTMHVQEGNAFYSGYYHTGRRQWSRITPYQQQKYWEKADEGEASPAAISNGMIFHNTMGNINARKAVVLP